MTANTTKSITNNSKPDNFIDNIKEKNAAAFNASNNGKPKKQGKTLE